MISVLIPIYNGIEFIEESVNSVINQTFREWELIIGVNGHSEDSDVFKIAKEYESKDLRIRVICLRQVGKSNALNEMLCQATYHWISVLDVDDIWFPTKLLSQLHYMEKYDVIGTMCQYFQDSSNVPSIPVGDLSGFSFYHCNPIINSSCLVRKHLCHWEEGVLEDYNMWLRLWKENRTFYNVRSIQVYHRIHSQSAFNSKGNSSHVPALIAKHKADIPKNEITFATCWYSVPSKFNAETYEKWMQNMLNHVNGFNLVIFTNEESKHMVEKYVCKNNKRMKIVIRELEEFHTFPFDWKKNHTKNHSLNEITDWRLNMIWNEKIHFVQEASKIYDTLYYGWMDIGYFRDNPIPTSWPTLSKISTDKIMYAIVCDDMEFQELNAIVKNENEHFLPRQPIPPGQISIAGGFFLSHKENLDWWHNTFYTRLQQYFENDYLVKDDQMVIVDCIIHHEDKFELGKNDYPKHTPNRWFFFQEFLS